MSGITAISPNGLVDAGSSSPVNTASGFLTKEQISFGLTGSPMSAIWSLSKPSTSGSACSIIGASSLNPVLTPDTEGVYVVSCLVDGSTTYVLTLSIVASSSVSTISALHLLPADPVQIPTPRSGATVFFNLLTSEIAAKYPDGNIVNLT